MNSSMDFADGFELIEKKFIPDCSSTGIYLRHKKTGMEVFHLLNDDKENLFAFAFRTPNDKSNGAAHIVEHSVFCGSQKYPLKDTFITLEAQSVQTFMNALTFPDKTVYPASSILPADYFNLMSVYADAVFFPNLSKEVFLQEGCRIEFDAKGKPQIQGIVYNEMKGAYSSFVDVASRELDASLLGDTIYAFSSGGAPEAIASLTYEEFLDFHKRHYVPQNCILFLYGNIPTKRQLGFIKKNVLDRFDARSVSISEAKKERRRILELETQKPFSKMKKRIVSAPRSSGETQSTVMLSWLLGNSDNMDDFAEAVFLGSILSSNDGSPISRVLLKSALGKDVSPCSGTDASVRQINFSVGLRAVKKENEQKVKDCVFAELKRLCEEGFSRDDIEAAFNGIEFSNREIKRFREPFSMVLMNRALRSWNYGQPPFNSLFVRDAFERLKKKINSNPNYASTLVKKRLLENRSLAMTIVRPEKSYLKERAAFEKNAALALAKKRGKKRIESDLALLEKFQIGENENPSCLPHIRPKDLKVYDEKLKIKKSEIFGTGLKSISKSAGGVPLFVSRENTNGIVYATAAFPVDVVESELYPYLPFFAYILNEVGWGGLSWEETSLLVAKTCGAFSTNVFSHTCSTGQAAREMLKTNRAFAGRKWLFCRIKMLDDKISAGFDLMRDCISGARYDDEKRVKVLAEELLGEIEGSLLPSGHMFASLRSECRMNAQSAIEEVWGGVRQLCTMREICSNIPGTIEKIKRIAKKVFSSGAVLHICADNSTMKEALRCARKFSSDLRLKPPAKKLAVSDEALYALTRFNKKNSSDKNEAIACSSMVGFAATSFKATRGLGKKAAAEQVLSHILNSSLLWEKIRMAGGAYGAFSSANALDGIFTLCTYRDPAAQKSLKVFDEALEEIAKMRFSKESIEKAVTGTYSSEIQVKTPFMRGNSAFLRELYLVDSNERQAHIKTIINITERDIRLAAKRLLRFRRQGAKSVVILGKDAVVTGNFGRIEI